MGEKKYGGIIVDPLGYIVTSVEELDSQKKEDLSKFKVDVHLNPGMSCEYTLSGELSYADLVNNIAIIKCNTDKLLPAARLKLGNTNRDCYTYENYYKDMLLSVSTDCGQNSNILNPLVADLVKVKRRDKWSFDVEKVWSCVFSSSTAPPNAFCLAVVNRDAEVVGVFNGCGSNHCCGTWVDMVYQTLNIAKNYGSYQPWIGVILADEKFVWHNLVVRMVAPNSPAASVGIRVGDAITTVEIIRIGFSEFPVHSFKDLYNELLLGYEKPLNVHLHRHDPRGSDRVVTVVSGLKEQTQKPFL